MEIIQSSLLIFSQGATDIQSKGVNDQWFSTPSKNWDEKSGVQCRLQPHHPESWPQRPWVVSIDKSRHKELTACWHLSKFAEFTNSLPLPYSPVRYCDSHFVNEKTRRDEMTCQFAVLVSGETETWIRTVCFPKFVFLHLCYCLRSFRRRWFFFSTCVCSNNITYSILKRSSTGKFCECEFSLFSIINAALLLEIRNGHILPRTSFFFQLEQDTCKFLYCRKSSKWCRNAIEISCENYF